MLAWQYGKHFTTEEVNDMTTTDKMNWLKRNPVIVARQIDYIFTKFLGPHVLMSGMHIIGQIINFDEAREFQGRCVQHPHVAIHVKDAPILDKNPESEVVQFIDKYITCAIPDKDTEPELHDLVTSRLTHKCTTTCRKKKGVRCRFNSPWPVSDQTKIARGEGVTRDEVKQSKKIVDKVLTEIVDNRTTEELCNVTLEDILHSSGVSEEEYENAMQTMQRNTAIHHKRQPNELNISPYNTVLLSLLKANMNLQFVTGVYGLLTYLTSYLCKAEKTVSELMKKAYKEANDKGIRGKLRKIGDVFLTKREVGIHEAALRLLSGPFRRYLCSSYTNWTSKRSYKDA